MNTFSPVRLSYGRCVLSPNFFQDFYDTFQAKSPEIRKRFENTDMKSQMALLRNGLTHLIMYAEGSSASKMKVERLATSHDAQHMNIPSWMYDHWVSALMVTIQNHDPEINGVLIKQWHDALIMGINYMISKR